MRRVNFEYSLHLVVLPLRYLTAQSGYCIYLISFILCYRDLIGSVINKQLLLTVNYDSLRKRFLFAQNVRFNHARKYQLFISTFALKRIKMHSVLSKNLLTYDLHLSKATNASLCIYVLPVV